MVYGPLTGNVGYYYWVVVYYYWVVVYHLVICFLFFPLAYFLPVFCWLCPVFLSVTLWLFGMYFFFYYFVICFPVVVLSPAICILKLTVITVNTVLLCTLNLVSDSSNSQGFDAHVTFPKSITLKSMVPPSTLP